MKKILEVRKNNMLNVFQSWSTETKEDGVFCKELLKLYWDLNNCWYSKNFLKEDDTMIRTYKENSVKSEPVIKDGIGLGVFAEPVIETVIQYPEIFWIEKGYVYCKFPEGITKL